MKIRDFVKIYEEDPLVLLLAHRLKESPNGRTALKGLSGSMDSLVVTALWHLAKQPIILVMNDKDEAGYMHTDLNNLLESKEASLFPASYKKAYQFLEVDNANILERAEVLSHISAQPGKPFLMVTYPEALAEKVINRRSLVENTLTIKSGDKIDIAFIIELLSGYDFERTEFVYEPGQFAVRGGLLDVFSYSGDHPVRIDFMGDQVQSLRLFEPETQLSFNKVEQFTVVPNVQTRLLEEKRVDLFEFLPKETIVFAKDTPTMFEIVDSFYTKAEAQWKEMEEKGTNLLLSEPELFLTSLDSFKNELKHRHIIEFGTKSHYRTSEPIVFASKNQPSFNKDFKKVASAFQQYKALGWHSLICSDQPKQLERLQSIFDEIDNSATFTPLYTALRAGFEDSNNGVVCFTDHQIFDRFYRNKTKERFTKSKGITLRELKTLQPGDFVTHMDYGIGRFAGLERVENNGKLQEAVRMVFRDDDYLLISIHSLHKLSKYSGKDALPPALSKLGTGDWEARKSKVKKRVKDIARELIELYAKRKATTGFAFSADSVMQAELETSFLYEDTPDQAKATADTKKDMEEATPMDRLVCGDVGFGKTEIAIRAAFKAVFDGKQVAVLVPTTILAMQHHKTFSERLRNFPCNIDYINRFKSDKEVKETLKKVSEGKIDILIGTHRLTSQDVKFKELGLLIIDEEQKFGVKTKEKIKALSHNVDCLTLTATPIPRTLQFSLMGARDLSIIATPPPNRQPVTTEVATFSQELIRDAVSFELKRGGQVFLVHNRISDIEEVANVVLRMVPDARVAVAHGQMEADKLENTMLRFMEGDYDVLVSTNIIESGLDIPNANTILINRAHMFGLSDLHQMRGRVGRSNKKAFCYLLVPPISGLTGDARKRLSTLEEFNELGDGFKVAMRDLDIRGAGDLLGAEQSGFITDMGFDAYHKILDDAIKELKEKEFKDLFIPNQGGASEIFVEDCVIETDLDLMIPEAYVKNISERLQIYTKMDSLENEEQLQEYIKSIEDRFGPIPNQMADIAETVRLRWLAEKVGFEKLTLKDRQLKGYFMPPDKTEYFQSEVFGKIIMFVQSNAMRSRLKEIGKKQLIVVEKVATVAEAMEVLNEMLGIEQPA